ncbi:MAG: hypothetical protein ACLQHF_14255 [Terracidiphilus sp.]
MNPRFMPGPGLRPPGEPVADDDLRAAKDNGNTANIAGTVTGPTASATLKLVQNLPGTPRCLDGLWRKDGEPPST